MEGLRPSYPPGEAESGSPTVHRPVKWGSYPPYRHGCEYRDTGCRCTFLQTPQLHIAYLEIISYICILTCSNRFGHHARNY